MRFLLTVTICLTAAALVALGVAAALKRYSGFELSNPPEAVLELWKIDPRLPLYF